LSIVDFLFLYHRLIFALEVDNPLILALSLVDFSITSTKVATNGADEVAGSSLNFFNKNGIIEPESVPHKTINTNDIETVIAKANQ